MVKSILVCRNIKEIMLRNKEITAHVHSVFENVVNLHTMEYGLITCTRNKGVMVPYGMLLNGDFRPENYKIGQAVSIVSTYTSGNENIYIDVKSVESVDLFLHKNTGNIDVYELVRVLKLYLKYNTPQFCIGEVISEISELCLEKIPVSYSRDIIDSLLPSFKGFIEKIKNAENLAEYRNVLGFGAGLTPSSDDFVLGMLSVFCFFNDIRHTLLKEYILRYIFKTTAISTNMLSNALNDNYPSYIIGFFDKIAVDTGEMEGVLDIFAKHGHSSGIDTLYGIYTGLYCII